jgi:hypothetical protein
MTAMAMTGMAAARGEDDKGSVSHNQDDQEQAQKMKGTG